MLSEPSKSCDGHCLGSTYAVLDLSNYSPANIFLAEVCCFVLNGFAGPIYDKSIE